MIKSVKHVNDLSHAWGLALIVAILLGALFVRVHDIAHTPPGVAFDSTWDLSDALRISRGYQFPAAFDTRSEPAHRWMLAAFLVVFGPQVFSAQLFQVYVSILTVALTYAAARTLFAGHNWRHLGALVAAGVIAANVNQIFLARIAYHAILVAPVVALTLILGLHAVRSQRQKWWFLTGFVGGLGVHTYQAGIPTPLLVVGLVIHQLLFARPRRGRMVLWTALGLLLPLAAWFTLIMLVPDLFFRIHAAGGDSLYNFVRILTGFVGAAREFFLTGYPIPLYGTPSMPYVSSLLAIFVVVGAVLAVWRWRSPEGALLIGGMILFILPASLSEDPTHPNRLVGTLPILGLLASWGVVFVFDAVARLSRQPQSGWRVQATFGAVCSLLIAGALVLTDASFQGMFADPSEYSPPDFWLGVPHNYNMALTEALDLLIKVDQPTYVPLEVLDTPQASFQLQRQAFPNVTTWVRFGLKNLPEGQFFFPVFGYYNTHAQDDDPCSGLLLPAEKTIVILPCDLNSSLEGQATSADAHFITDERGWQIARLTPVAAQPLKTPRLTAQDQAPSVGQGLQVAGEQTPDTVRAGDQATVLVYWRVVAPQPTDIFSLAQLIDLNMGQFGDSEHHTLGYLYPSARWQPGDIIPDRHVIQVQANLPSGVYRWGIGALVPPGVKRLPVTPVDSGLDDLWLWSAVRVPKPQPGQLPTDATPLDVRFDDHIDLAGYRLDQTASSWAVTLYWRVDAPPQGDYIVFVHAMSGDKMIAQRDAKPFDGKIPTWSWTPGEIIETSCQLDVTAGKPDKLYAGLYPYPSLQRLSVTQNGHLVADSRATVWSTP